MTLLAPSTATRNAPAPTPAPEAAAEGGVHSEEEQNFLVHKLQLHLSLSPHDVVAHLGAGSGGLAHLLFRKVPLKAKVVCTDTRGGLLEKALNHFGGTSVSCARMAPADFAFAGDDAVARPDSAFATSLGHGLVAPGLSREMAKVQLCVGCYNLAVL